MEQERPLKERIWEFTKDLSVKVSRKAEKHWKINTLRVEIASIKHRINVKYKELGRFVYDSFKDDTLEDDSYTEGRNEVIKELIDLEKEIAEREKRIEELEIQMEQMPAQESMDDDLPPSPPPIAEEPPSPPPPIAEEPPSPPPAPEEPAANAEAESDESKEKGDVKDDAESKA